MGVEKGAVWGRNLPANYLSKRGTQNSEGNGGRRPTGEHDRTEQIPNINRKEKIAQKGKGARAQRGPQKASC